MAICGNQKQSEAPRLQREEVVEKEAEAAQERRAQRRRPVLELGEARGTFVGERGRREEQQPEDVLRGTWKVMEGQWQVNGRSMEGRGGARSSSLRTRAAKRSAGMWEVMADRGKVSGRSWKADERSVEGRGRSWRRT